MANERRCPSCGGTNFMRTASNKIIDGKQRRVWVTSCDECGKEIKFENII